MNRPAKYIRRSVMAFYWALLFSISALWLLLAMASMLGGATRVMVGGEYWMEQKEGFLLAARLLITLSALLSVATEPFWGVHALRWLKSRLAAIRLVEIGDGP